MHASLFKGGRVLEDLHVHYNDSSHVREEEEEKEFYY